MNLKKLISFLREEAKIKGNVKTQKKRVGVFESFLKSCVIITW